MFLMMPSTKIAQTSQLGWTKPAPELKIEISLNDISLTTDRSLVKSAYQKKISQPKQKISQPKHMFWVFKRTVSMSTQNICSN